MSQDVKVEMSRSSTTIKNVSNGAIPKVRTYQKPEFFSESFSVKATRLHKCSRGGGSEWGALIYALDGRFVAEIIERAVRTPAWFIETKRNIDDVMGPSVHRKLLYELYLYEEKTV
jgi:hypothetical protein